MPFPIILVSSASGSDTAASGAGPATALTGTAATSSADGLTVTLDGSPDLSGVATDGSHALYLHETVAGRRCFARITGKDDGAKTVTVSEAVRLSIPAGDSIDWAIGGKRASIASTQSKKLFDNNAAAGDAKPGWAVEMQSGHAETISARLDVRNAGDTTDGPIILRGVSGAATRPVVTLSGATTDFVPRGSYWRFQDFALAGAGGATNCVIDTAFKNRYEGLKISGFSGVLLDGSSNAGISLAQVVGCELSGGSIGVRCSQDPVVAGNYIHGQTSHGISRASGVITGLFIHANVVAGCGGDGINVAQTRTDDFAACIISHNTIDGCTGDGIDYTGDNDGLSALTILNNILSNNGGYGINFTGLTAAKVLARGTVVKGNNTYGNTSGASNLSGVLEDDPGLDPQYANAAGGDYSIGTNLKAQGFPEANVGSTSATRSYVDIGAAQREEPAGGGGITFFRRGGTLMKM